MDGIRAISALLVLLFHAHIPGFGGGLIGVDVFFVLSGYFITLWIWRELDATGGFRYWRFAGKRMLRIFPSLWLCLAVYAAVLPLLWPNADMFSEIVVSGLLIRDYVRDYGFWPNYLRHTWSLAVELHFYLFWPLILLVLHRLFERRAFYIVVALFCAATAWRIWFSYEFGFSSAYGMAHTRMSGLILGSALALLPWSVPQKLGAALGWGGLIGLGLMTYTIAWETGAEMFYAGIVTDIAAACLVLSQTGDDGGFLGRCLSWGPLPALGLCSYELYVWHYTIARYAIKFLSPVETLLVTATLSVALAWLTFNYFYKPLTGLILRDARRPVVDEQRPREAVT